MTIIEATSVSFKTMSDGSLRQTIEYSPIHAQDAFKLYGGVPGAPMGTFRLTQDAAKQSAQAETIKSNAENWEWAKAIVQDGKKEVVVETFDKPKGGALAKLAGIFCNDPKFWDWLNNSGIAINIGNDQDAKLAIYEICGVMSRIELDMHQSAADRFHKFIRIPFVEFKSKL